MQSPRLLHPLRSPLSTYASRAFAYQCSIHLLQLRVRVRVRVRVPSGCQRQRQTSEELERQLASGVMRVIGAAALITRTCKCCNALLQWRLSAGLCNVYGGWIYLRRQVYLNILRIRSTPFLFLPLSVCSLGTLRERRGAPHEVIDVFDSCL